MANSRQRKILTGAAVGIAVGVGLYLWSRRAGAAPIVTPPPGPGPGPGPAIDEPAPVTPAGPTAPSGSRVPAKGAIPYNMAMFPNTEAVRGRLAGLSPKYAFVSAPTAALAEAVTMFQFDWNDLSKGNELDPSRLNGTALKVDGVAGRQTLRALEWAVGMNWPQRLAGAGLGA